MSFAETVPDSKLITTIDGRVSASVRDVVGITVSATVVAGAIADMINVTLPAVYRDLDASAAQVHLLDFGDALLKPFSDKAHGYAAKVLVFGLVVAFQPGSVLACSACYGQSDSPMAQGMNWGIFSLLAIVVTVLGGIAGFFVYLARRSGTNP